MNDVGVGIAPHAPSLQETAHENVCPYIFCHHCYCVARRRCDFARGPLFFEFDGLRGWVGALLVYREHAMGQRERDLVHLRHLPGAVGAGCGIDGVLGREVRARTPGEFGQSINRRFLLFLVPSTTSALSKPWLPCYFGTRFVCVRLAPAGKQTQQCRDDVVHNVTHQKLGLEAAKFKRNVITKNLLNVVLIYFLMKEIEIITKF